MSPKNIIITVAIFIVVVWIAGALLKVVGWLIHALLPVAVILLVIYFFMRKESDG